MGLRRKIDACMSIVGFTYFYDMNNLIQYSTHSILITCIVISSYKAFPRICPTNLYSRSVSCSCNIKAAGWGYNDPVPPEVMSNKPRFGSNTIIDKSVKKSLNRPPISIPFSSSPLSSIYFTTIRSRILPRPSGVLFSK